MRPGNFFPARRTGKDPPQERIEPNPFSLRVRNETEQADFGESGCERGPLSPELLTRTAVEDSISLFAEFSAGNLSNSLLSLPSGSSASGKIGDDSENRQARANAYSAIGKREKTRHNRWVRGTRERECPRVFRFPVALSISKMDFFPKSDSCPRPGTGRWPPFSQKRFSNAVIPKHLFLSTRSGRFGGLPLTHT